jgi:hypothetical protein
MIHRHTDGTVSVGALELRMNGFRLFLHFLSSFRIVYYLYLGYLSQKPAQR